MPRGRAAPATNAQAAVTTVHMFWIGETLPAWVPACVESYVEAGHKVLWWLYLREERASDLARVAPDGLLENSMLQLRDAAEVLPFKQARRMFFHGIGEEGRGSGFGPLSDWFRYEVVSRHGGWWADADSVCVRRLDGLVDELGPGGPIICTQPHRLDQACRQGTAGAIALPPPGAKEAEQHQEALAGVGAAPQKVGDFHRWVCEVREAGLDVGVVSNSFFFSPKPGDNMLRSLAGEMRELLDSYAQEVEQEGVDAVRQRCSLPSHLVGLQLLQRSVRNLLQFRLLEPGRLVHYRARRDVHCQHPPETLSVSLTLSHAHGAQGWTDQHTFVPIEGSVGGFRIASIAGHGPSETFLRVAVALGSEEAGELARHFGKRHPSDRMRLTAWRALAGAAPDREGRDAIWREAEAAGSRAVAAVAKLRRG
ncbi:MAG: hypothetical protein CMH85_08840 [Novosphingobium sp.]|nr:hypothetical protein [Novosphingobium sp.]